MITKQISAAHALLLRTLADNRIRLERQLEENAAMRSQLLQDASRSLGAPDGVAGYYDAENMTISFEGEGSDATQSPST